MTLQIEAVGGGHADLVGRILHFIAKVLYLMNDFKVQMNGYKVACFQTNWKRLERSSLKELKLRVFLGDCYCTG